MSTNFYWNPGPTSAFSPLAPVHIGKRSGGWSFSFQAFMFEGSRATERFFEVSSGLSIKVPVPELPPLSIKSFVDWMQILCEPESTIEDEYGSPLTLEQFLEIVANLHPVTGRWNAGTGVGKPLLNHFDELVKNVGLYGPVDTAKNWKDAEGYSFSLCDFC